MNVAKRRGHDETVSLLESAQSGGLLGSNFHIIIYSYFSELGFRWAFDL